MGARLSAPHNGVKRPLQSAGVPATGAYVGASGAASSLGEVRFDDPGMVSSFTPAGPRDSDEAVDVWKYLLGIGTSDLPQGREIIGAGGPLLPHNRADWMVQVIRGFSTQQQLLMTIGLVTTVRALMTELGWAMHAASLVEVVLDPETEEDQGEETGLFQVETVSFVQQVVTKAYGILQKLQAELEGPSLGLARLRAKHLRKKLRKLRSDARLGDPELADRSWKRRGVAIVTMGSWLWRSRWRRGRGTGCPS